MALERNVLVTYGSHIYVTVLGIAMLPVYMQHLGAEAYGLVGFFMMLQGWFLLLDMGLTPTMSREVAKFRGGGVDSLGLRRLLRAMEGFFLLVAALGATFLIVGSEHIAKHWLNAEHLSLGEVACAIRIMTLIMVLRWVSELYRGVVTGFEEMVWLGIFAASMATIRFVLVIPFFIWVSNSVIEFFLFQLGAAVVEAFLLIGKAYALLPAVPVGGVHWSWKPLRKIAGFALAIAMASLVWILASQTDKLLLSGLLSLEQYGWFSLSVLAASGVLILTAPVVAALLPRLTALHAHHDESSLRSLYKTATQWIGLVVWPVCGILAWQAERVLWIWTGDTGFAAQGTATLCLYALGNGVMALGALPYYLQFAKGQMRLHLLGTGFFVLLLLPCLLWAAPRYGAVGAGCVWLAVNLLYFILWVPVAHARYAPGLHYLWMRHDVLPIAALAFSVALISRWLPWPDQRMLMGLQLLAVSGVTFLSGAIGSSWVRSKLTHRFSHVYLG